MNERKEHPPVDQTSPPRVETESTELVNLLRNFDAAVDAVMQVESAISSTAENVRDVIRSAMSDTKAALEGGRSRGGFEGTGGFNRYYVESDGYIVLLQSHTIQRCIDKAKEVGILVKRF